VRTASTAQDTSYPATEPNTSGGYSAAPGSPAGTGYPYNNAPATPPADPSYPANSAPAVPAANGGYGGAPPTSMQGTVSQGTLSQEAAPQTGAPASASSYADGTEYSSVDRNWQPGNTGYNPPGAAGYPSSNPPATTPATTDRQSPSWRPGTTSDYLPSRGAQSSRSNDSSGYGVTTASYTTPSQTAPPTGGGYPTSTTGPAYGGNAPAGAAGYPTGPGGNGANPGASGYGANGPSVVPDTYGGAAVAR
jgi:hypothetical protein